MDAPFHRIVGTEELASGLPIPIKAGYLFSFLNGRTSATRKRNDAVLLRQEQGRNFFPECSLSDGSSMDRFGS
jgi:hypothetical protein